MPIGPFYPDLSQVDPTEDPYLAELRSQASRPFVPGKFRGGATEIFSGLEDQGLPQPRSFGEGVLYGAVRALGSSGTQAQQRRAKFEESEAQRRKDLDAERRAASAELRQLSGQDRREVLKERAQYERENVVPRPDQIAVVPWIMRTADEKGRVNRAALNAAIKEASAPPKAETPQRPMLIDTPNGPRYVEPRQAIGQAPPKGGAAAAKPATGQERQTLAFYNRAKDSAETILQPQRNGQNLDQMIGLNAGSQVKIAMARSHASANALLSPEEQVYLQAQRQFTEARLRKESGAAISPKEYENDAQTYFAQPGDKPAAIERKRKAREKVLEGLRFGAGKAYDEFYGGQIPTESGGNADIDAEYQDYLRSQGR